MNIKEFFKRDNLDEMQKQTLLKIESRGFWVLWVLLLAALIIESLLGFAPRENPRIAIAVYVENAGWGATYGVPIGSLMMEKYLNGEIAPSRKWLEERMLKANTMIQEEEEENVAQE